MMIKESVLNRKLNIALITNGFCFIGYKSKDFSVQEWKHEELDKTFIINMEE